MTKLFEDIRERLEKATPGRWDFYLKHEDPDFPSTIAFNQIAAYDNCIKTHIVMCRLGVPDKICMEKTDAELIAHSPTDIARLLKAVDLAVEALKEPCCLPCQVVHDEALADIKKISEEQ